MPHSSADEAIAAPPLSARTHERSRRAGRRSLVPAAAAGVAFVAALGVGIATKSSPARPAATSLAPPVAIQAPRAALPALARDVQTPALKPKARKPPAPKPQPIAPTAPVSVAPPASTSIATPPPRTPTTGVTHTPTTGVVHSQGGNGGSGVVHGGN